MGIRRLELWFAWEDGEIDFIFPENPDLLFEDKLQAIWKNWEDYTDPLLTWIEQFLLVYSEASRRNAVLSTWQEEALATLNSDRNKKYDVVNSTVIVVADAFVNEFTRKKFPSIRLSLQVTLSPKRFVFKETRVKVTSDDSEVGELNKLHIN